MAKNEQKMVKVRLYLGDRGELKKPLEVWVNGEHFSVPRGVEYEVPDFVAAAIADSEQARYEEMRYNETHARVEA